MLQVYAIAADSHITDEQNAINVPRIRAVAWNCRKRIDRIYDWRSDRRAVGTNPPVQPRTVRMRHETRTVAVRHAKARSNVRTYKAIITLNARIARNEMERFFGSGGDSGGSYGFMGFAGFVPSMPRPWPVPLAHRQPVSDDSLRLALL